MARPAMPPGKNKIQTHVTLPREVRDMAREIMKTEGLTMSAILEDGIRKEYAKLKKEKKAEKVSLLGQMTFDQMDRLFKD